MESEFSLMPFGSRMLLRVRMPVQLVQKNAPVMATGRAQREAKDVQSGLLSQLVGLIRSVQQALVSMFRRARMRVRRVQKNVPVTVTGHVLREVTDVRLGRLSRRVVTV